LYCSRWSGCISQSKGKEQYIFAFDLLHNFRMFELDSIAFEPFMFRSWLRNTTQAVLGENLRCLNCR
jgi:hypothetical protein